MSDYRAEKVTRCRTCGEVYCLADGFCECHRIEDEEAKEEAMQDDAFLKTLEKDVPGWNELSHENQLWAMEIFSAGRLSVLNELDKDIEGLRKKHDLH